MQVKKKKTESSPKKRSEMSTLKRTSTGSIDQLLAVLTASYLLTGQTVIHPARLRVQFTSVLLQFFLSLMSEAV